MLSEQKYVHEIFRTTLLLAILLAERSLKDLHSIVSPSISRDATNSRTCDTTKPPYEPGIGYCGLLFVIRMPFLYHAIVDAGLEESVWHVNVTVLLPFANTDVLPMMFVLCGLTETVKQFFISQKQYMYKHFKH